MRTTYFLVGVFGHRWNVWLMKSKIVKVKSFQNHLTYYWTPITEFSILVGHPNVHILHKGPGMSLGRGILVDAS